MVMVIPTVIRLAMKFRTDSSQNSPDDSKTA